MQESHQHATISQGLSDRPRCNSHGAAVQGPAGRNGKRILFKWPPRLGGWLVGTIEEANASMGQESEGEFSYNFKVAYTGEDERALLCDK